MILVISSPGDLHAKVVLEELDRLGEPAQLVDLSTFPAQMTMTGRYGLHGAPLFELAPVGSPTIDLNDVRSVWWRRPQPFGIPAAVTDPAMRNFVLSETSTAFAGMWQSMDCLWVKDIVRDSAAAHKPWQLATAREVGLTVPDTLITNEPDEARSFWSSHPGRVVFKPFLQTYAAWRETRVLRRPMPCAWRRSCSRSSFPGSRTCG
jgi:hypothetical protein